MHLPPSAFGAYREDLRRSAPRTSLGPADHEWLLVATGLERLAQLLPGERAIAARRLATAFREEQTGEGDEALADALDALPGQPGADALLARARAVCADMERSGALLLARVTLEAAATVGAAAGALERGLAIVQQGRIARTLGEMDEARERYESAAELGRAEGAAEVEARGWIGIGALCRARGNYPDAREHYEKGLALASGADVMEVVGLAHQGLLGAAVASGDMSAALVHGWAAFQHAQGRGADAEAEALVNLAHVCMESGGAAAALAGNFAVLARTATPRLRIPALAGATDAASRLQRAETVGRLARMLQREQHESFPFETARAWSTLAVAYARLADPGASARAADRARSLAKSGGFFEVMYAIDQLRTAPPASAAITDAEAVERQESLSPEARYVVRSVEELPMEDEELLLATTGGRSTGW